MEAITDAENILFTNETILALTEIDDCIQMINDHNFIANTTTFFISTLKYEASNFSSLLVSFDPNVGSQVIRTNDTSSRIDPSATAAVSISNQYLINNNSLSMLTISEPTAYKNTAHFHGRYLLASAIIVLSHNQVNPSSSHLNISLYFKVIDNFINDNYFCLYYNTTIDQWEGSSDTKPMLISSSSKQYECKWDHLTSFALFWGPNDWCTNTTHAVNHDSMCMLKNDLRVCNTYFTRFEIGSPFKECFCREPKKWQSYFGSDS